MFIIHAFNNNTQIYKLGYKELSTDTNYFWTPMSKLIYENDLFYALENNIIPGYGLLINYIHAINFKIFFNYEFFTYIPVTSNIFFFLGLYFIYELRFEIHIKLSALLIYFSIFSPLFKMFLKVYTMHFCNKIPSSIDVRVPLMAPGLLDKNKVSWSKVFHRIIENCTEQ